MLAAGCAVGGNGEVVVFDDAAVEAMCSQIAMSSFTAPCCIINPLLPLSLLKFKRI